MSHEPRIEHDERFLSRPWGIKCSCRFEGAALSKEEAERIAELHKVTWEFYDSLMPSAAKPAGSA